MIFSDKVKRVRKRLYLTQGELAKKLGVSCATVNRWENQNREPQLALLGRFDDLCAKHGILFENGKHNKGSAE